MVQVLTIWTHCATTMTLPRVRLGGKEGNDAGDRELHDVAV
jgi:hypothetical protein